MFALAGLALLAGGIALLAAAGSPYYALSGAVLLVVAVLVARDDRRARAAYLVLLAATVAWSLWEVGFAGWLLVPRLVAPLVLGVLVLIVPLHRHPPQGAARQRRDRLAAAGALLLAVAVGGGLHAAGPADPADPWLRRGLQTTAPSALPQPMASLSNTDWPAFGNDQGGTHFSPLTQIDPANVGKLALAWTADIGPGDGGPANGMETVPVMVGNSLYACSGYNRVAALDAETGRTRWNTDISGGQPSSGKPCRGVAFFKVPGATGLCAERILAANQTPMLVALDAATGAPCPGFGQHGTVDLRTNLGPYPHRQYYISSAPQIVRGKVVVGGGIPDNQVRGGPSGVIRAFDAVTGELAWAFDAGTPDRTGAPPEGQAYTHSSPNSWAPISADETLGLVFMPMGGATPDNYGGDRRPFDDVLGDTVTALDAETGRVRWSFQTVHHDLWDYDVSPQPMLVDWPTPTGPRPALIEGTKVGDIYVLDRATGKPILPVVEQPAPQGGQAPGERLSLTQPGSPALPAFRGPLLREKDMWGATPIDQMLCRLQFRRSRYQGTFTPLTLNKPTLIAPGSAGGIDWGGESLDADRGILTTSWMLLPDRVELVTREEADRRHFKLNPGNTAGGDIKRPMLNTPYGAYGGGFLSPLGIPCNAPPWGMVGAVDLFTGQLLWAHPLGTARDLGPFGIPTLLPITIGTPLTGGSLSTRSGLVFIGAAAESSLRALDGRTGRELWQGRLPAPGNASPVTYRGPSGRQFVVIAAGGRTAFKTGLSTKILAFALPDGTAAGP